MFRRIILVLTMFLVPFQISWAAAGIYCQHETGAAARHFGHHEHHHSSPDKSSFNGKLDPDCSYHNHAHIQAVTSELPALAVLPTGSAKVGSDNQFRPLTVLYRPDRPKWLAASEAAS